MHQVTVFILKFLKVDFRYCTSYRLCLEDAHLESISLDPRFQDTQVGEGSGNCNPQEGTIAALTDILDWPVGNQSQRLKEGLTSSCKQIRLLIMLACPV